MGKMILYGNKLSPPVRVVLLVADAINLNEIKNMEYKHIDFSTNQHLSEEFIKINPQHTVPTLEDDGKYIWDSHAIVTYLIDKYAKTDELYSKDLYTRALINQKLYFDAEILYIRLRSISMGIYYSEEKTIPQHKIDDVYEGYDFMEKFLNLSTYLVGDKLTVADLCCATTISSCQGFAPINKDKYPKLWDWMKKIESLPYYESANGKDAKIYVEFLKDLLKKKNEKSN